MASATLLDLRNELVEFSLYFNENPIVLAGATLLCCYFCVAIFRRISLQQSHQEALQTMVNKRFARDEVVHKSLETKAQNTTPLVDATELISEYKAGTRTCADALLQLVHASHDIGLHPLYATTEEFYDEALSTATAVDSQRGKQGHLAVGEGELGTLAGVPISIKDNYHMKGADSTLGIACRCFKPRESDGVLVGQLRAAGAVPYVKSNIPPLLLMPESDNKHLWGTCRNPWDLNRTPGGSSGGEAALVASGCSLWGLGGDIGGSIRIPATYCGVVGFKPSYHRVSKQGSAVNRVGDRTGQQIIVASAGPLARSVRDCALMMEVLTRDLPSHDYTAPPLPWRADIVRDGLMVPASANDNVSSSPSPKPTGTHKRRTKKSQEADLAALKSVIADPPTITSDPMAVTLVPKRQRVAVMTTDDWCEPVPAVKRAVQEAADVLRACGYEVVPFQNPINTTRMLQTYLALMSADGNWHQLTQAMEGEALSDSYNTLKKYTDFPTVLRPPLRWLLQNTLGEKRRAAMFGLVPNGGSNVREYWGSVADMKDMQAAYQQYFRNAGLDAILMPTLPMTAPPHGMAPDLIPMLTYTFLANMLHWPAGSVPVTCVHEDEQYYDIASLPVFQQDGLAKMLQKATEGSAGSPVGVQIMTPMWQDENCLHIMADVEKQLPFTARPAVCANTV